MQEGFLTTHRTLLHASPEQVWAALTEPVLVKQYFFGTDLSTDWTPGSPIRFTGTWDGTAYEDKGTVLEFDPPRRLRYSYLSSWNALPDIPENYLQITCTLQPVANGVELVITQSNYDAAKAAHSEASWKAVTDGLRQLVEKSAVTG